jgi:hypothetical protein
MSDVTTIVEGGMLRAVYVDGKYVEAEVFDFDVLDGGDEEELRNLLSRIDESPHGTKLRTDLLTWREDVARALDFVER